MYIEFGRCLVAVSLIDVTRVLSMGDAVKEARVAAGPAEPFLELEGHQPQDHQWRDPEQ